MRLFSPRIMVYMWMTGFVGSFLIQTVLQTWFAENSYWGPNQGWQNEIAIWNAGMFFVILGVIRSGLNAERYVLFGLFVLSLCFGINHGAALLKSTANISNWMGFILNLSGVFIYIVYLTIGQDKFFKSKDSDIQNIGRT